MVNNRGHVGTVSYQITLLLGKPPRGSLPGLSAYSLASKFQLAPLESAGAGNYHFYEIVRRMRGSIAGQLASKRTRYRSSLL